MSEYDADLKSYEGLVKTCQELGIALNQRFTRYRCPARGLNRTVHRRMPVSALCVMRFGERATPVLDDYDIGCGKDYGGGEYWQKDYGFFLAFLSLSMGFGI